MERVNTNNGKRVFESFRKNVDLEDIMRKLSKVSSYKLDTKINTFNTMDSESDKEDYLDFVSTVLTNSVEDYVFSKTLLALDYVYLKHGKEEVEENVIVDVLKKIKFNIIVSGIDNQELFSLEIKPYNDYFPNDYNNGFSGKGLTPIVPLTMLHSANTFIVTKAFNLYKKISFTSKVRKTIKEQLLKLL